MKKQNEALKEAELEAIAAGDQTPTEEEREAAREAAADSLAANQDRFGALRRQYAGHQARQRLL